MLTEDMLHTAHTLARASAGADRRVRRAPHGAPAYRMQRAPWRGLAGLGRAWTGLAGRRSDDEGARAARSLRGAAGEEAKRIHPYRPPGWGEPGRTRARASLSPAAFGLPRACLLPRVTKADLV